MIYRETERCEKCDNYIRYRLSGSNGKYEINRSCKCGHMNQSIEDTFWDHEPIRDLFESSDVYEQKHFNSIPGKYDHLKSTKQELLDCIQNLMGILDTPISRRKICGEFADEVRKDGRGIIDKYRTYFNHQ